jgi:hypothetical protein
MKIKSLVPLSPELFILGSLIYYWVAISRFNPIAIILIFIISFQIIKQQLISGIIISIIFVMLNLYMVLALIAELSEFESTNRDFPIMFLVGSLYLGFNLCFGCMMLIKYLSKANGK